MMNNSTAPDRYRLGAKHVRRIGYGAMQLSGPGAFGPPRDRDEAIAVLREAVANGVDHIDTSDIYGPRVSNELIREALAPYPDELVIATKVGAVRGRDGSWIPAFSATDIESAVHDNLRRLGLDALDVVNFRAMFDAMRPAEGSIEAPLVALADLQRRGLVRYIGVSNVTAQQLAEARRIVEVVCVQNHYNLAHRADDAMIDALAASEIAFVPYFPLGGWAPLQSRALDEVAARHGASPRQIALAWLRQRSPNILLIPGTSSAAHLRENLASAAISLTDDDRRALAPSATDTAP